MVINLIAIALWMRPQRQLPDKREALDPELNDVRGREPAYSPAAARPKMTRPMQCTAYSAGTVLAPSPSERCIMTVSSQRPNLKPTFGWVPIMANPVLACTPIYPALAESPITAIICR